ncbi:MAG: hypothetical protein H7831_08030 [Magnetococcus sp. WYHC-3]
MGRVEEKSSGEWHVDMDEMTATHQPTGLIFEFVPDYHQGGNSYFAELKNPDALPGAFTDRWAENLMNEAVNRFVEALRAQDQWEYGADW